MKKLVAGFVGNPGPVWLDAATLVVLFASVLLYLSLRGATNICLFLLAAPSLVYLPAAWRAAGRTDSRRTLGLVALALAAPILAVAIGQALRGVWIAKAFDAPSRLLLAIPVMCFLHYKRIDLARILGLAAPLALLELVVQIHLDPQALVHWGGRFATYFADTDTFGVYASILAALGLFGMRPAGQGRTAVDVVLAIVSVVAGAYLVIGSQTRTAYLLVPMVAVLWFVLHRPKINRLSFTIGALVVVAGAAAFLAFHGAGTRVASIYGEAASWADASNRDTSGGLRLTMWHIAWKLFLHQPLAGYGDGGYRALLDMPWITAFASEMARQTISAGPHNELLANLLRSGVAGGVAVVLLYVLPIVVLWRARALRRGCRARADGVPDAGGRAVRGVHAEVHRHVQCVDDRGPRRAGRGRGARAWGDTVSVSAWARWARPAMSCRAEAEESP
ncbi:MAG: hypothetical protein GAK40_01281 [Burkholderia plantarii]|nr:MAG: hypothetical protein GAK40_01281 [Burkholderia plantarii]